MLKKLCMVLFVLGAMHGLGANSTVAIDNCSITRQCAKGDIALIATGAVGCGATIAALTFTKKINAFFDEHGLLDGSFYVLAAGTTLIELSAAIKAYKAYNTNATLAQQNTTFYALSAAIAALFGLQTVAYCT